MNNIHTKFATGNVIVTFVGGWENLLDIVIVAIFVILASSFHVFFIITFTWKKSTKIGFGQN